MIFYAFQFVIYGLHDHKPYSLNTEFDVWVHVQLPAYRPLKNLTVIAECGMCSSSVKSKCTINARTVIISRIPLVLSDEISAASQRTGEQIYRSQWQWLDIKPLGKSYCFQFHLSLSWA